MSHQSCADVSDRILMSCDKPPDTSLSSFWYSAGQELSVLARNEAVRLDLSNLRHHLKFVSEYYRLGLEGMNHLKQFEVVSKLNEKYMD